MPEQVAGDGLGFQLGGSVGTTVLLAAGVPRPIRLPHVCRVRACGREDVRTSDRHMYGCVVSVRWWDWCAVRSS